MTETGLQQPLLIGSDEPSAEDLKVVLPKRQRLTPAQLLAVPRGAPLAEPGAASCADEEDMLPEPKPWFGRTRSTMAILEAPSKKKLGGAKEASSSSGPTSLRRSFSNRWKTLTPSSQRLHLALAKGASSAARAERKEKPIPPPTLPPLPPPKSAPPLPPPLTASRISGNTRSKSAKATD